MIFTSNPCGPCGCRARGSYTETIKFGPSKGEPKGIKWDTPPAACGCECHAAWRFVHGIPASAVAA